MSIIIVGAQSVNTSSSCHPKSLVILYRLSAAEEVDVLPQTCSFRLIVLIRYQVQVH